VWSSHFMFFIPLIITYMKINLEITLSSGAKVTLTEEQMNNVESYIKTLILGRSEAGKTTGTKHRKVFPRGARKWTFNEDQRIATEVLPLRGQDFVRKAQELAEEMNRTPRSIKARRDMMRRQMKSRQ